MDIFPTHKACILPKRCANVQHNMELAIFVLIVALLLGGAVGIVIVLEPRP